jgi:hypothetical protein
MFGQIEAAPGEVHGQADRLIDGEQAGIEQER